LSFSGNQYPNFADKVITTRGDIIRGDSSGDRARYGIGASATVLTSDGTDPAWAAATLAPTTTKGDISGYSTTQARIPISTNNYSLFADSAQALGLKWAASSTSILAASGDILYASSANTLAKLAKATDGDTLQLASGVPAWVTVSAGAGVVTGSIIPYGGAYTDSVSGYLQCDGDAVSRTTYSDLFGVTSTQFGVGDGATTFNLPDFNSKFARGAPSSTSCGDTGGADTVALSEAELASHTHVVTALYNGAGTYAPYDLAAGKVLAHPTTTTTPATGITLANTGSGTAHQNMPAYLEILYIIKT